MEFKDVPRKTNDNLHLSTYGRIMTYAEDEISTLIRNLVFKQLSDEALILKLKEIILTIEKLQND